MVSLFIHKIKKITIDEIDGTDDSNSYSKSIRLKTENGWWDIHLFSKDKNSLEVIE